MADKKITDLQLISSVTGSLSIPGDNGIQTYRFTPAQLFTYLRPLIAPGMLSLDNLQINTSVGSSALTIALKTNAGSDASSTDKIRVAFRSATATSGAFNLREISGAISLVISSGSTLGQASNVASRLWVYLIDNAGTPELAVSNKKFDESTLVSTTAEGGSGGADSYNTMYSNSARSNVPCRIIGYIDNTQSTAGTWASAGTTIQLMPWMKKKSPTQTVLTSGSSATYNKPLGCTSIKVRMVGGGGCGSPTGSSGSTPGSNGSSTTFTDGTNTATAGGGGANAYRSSASTSSASFSGFSGLGIPGGNGGQWMDPTATSQALGGAMGGSSFFGGGAPGSAYNDHGQNAPANTGGGGGGGGNNSRSDVSPGGGGAAGAYCEFTVNDPLPAYTYTVGGGGTGATAGTNGKNGGNGGSGVIVIDEFYE